MQKRLKLTESIVGLLTMIAGGGIIYYLVCKRWSDVFLMSLIFAAIKALLLAVITVQDWCDMLIEKIFIYPNKRVEIVLKIKNDLA